VTNIFDRLGLPPVINGAGKMTALGGSAQTDEVADAERDAARWHVDLQALRDRAGQRIAALTGAEAASITPGAAAGIAIAVAACITGSDLDLVRRVPLTAGLSNRVLLQSGHDIDFGAPIEQMIRLGGGVPEVIGTRTRVTERELVQALTTRTDVAALLFVQSHHCVQRDRISLAVCIARCHAAGVPVIVDAAAEEDLVRYVALGADLVTYSGGKAFGGPTSGFIAGSAVRVAACELQQRGIARAMKVGKEQIAGLLVALERYADADMQVESGRRKAVLQALHQGLGGIAGLEVALQPDEAGRDIERLAIALAAPRDLHRLVRRLSEGTPSIRTRNHHLSEGYVLIDPREMSIEQAEMVVARVREALGE